MFALTIFPMLRTGVSGLVVATLRCGSEGNVEQRTDDHGQKRGVVGGVNTYYAQRPDGDRHTQGNETERVPRADLVLA
jgi:hypothetical protein